MSEQTTRERGTWKNRGRRFRSRFADALMQGVVLTACLIGGAIIAVSAAGETNEEANRRLLEQITVLQQQQVSIGLAEICQLGVKTVPTADGGVTRPEGITNSRCLIPNGLEPQDFNHNGDVELEE